MPNPNQSRRDPVSEKPSRHPGDSLISQAYDNHILYWTVLIGWSGGLVAGAFVAWVGHWFAQPHVEWMLTGVAAISCAWTAAIYLRNCQRVENLFKGARGERAVADVLDEIRRERQYYVFHDLPVSRDGVEVANVDHVLIGPAGVFALETKYCTRPSKECRVTFDGTRVRVAGNLPDREPLAQARASAEDVRKRIKHVTTRDLAVRPVVLYPGWPVDSPSGQDFWLLNPKQLHTWLRKEELFAANHNTALTPEIARQVARAFCVQLAGDAR